MTDSSKNDTGWKLHTDRVYRKWTEKELMSAINYLKEKRPEIWQELIDKELRLDEIDVLYKSEVRGRIFSILSQLHPESDSTDNGNLFLLIIDILHKEIEVSLSNGR